MIKKLSLLIWTKYSNINCDLNFNMYRYSYCSCHLLMICWKIGDSFVIMMSIIYFRFISVYIIKYLINFLQHTFTYVRLLMFTWIRMHRRTYILYLYKFIKKSACFKISSVNTFKKSTEYISKEMKTPWKELYGLYNFQCLFEIRFLYQNKIKLVMQWKTAL